VPLVSHRDPAAEASPGAAAALKQYHSPVNNDAFYRLRASNTSLAYPQVYSFFELRLKTALKALPSFY